MTKKLVSNVQVTHTQCLARGMASKMLRYQERLCNVYFKVTLFKN